MSRSANSIPCMRYFPFITLLVILLILGGCSGFAPTAEPVTIKYAYPQSDQTTVEALLPKFNESNPSITVELQPVSYEGLRDLSITDYDVIGSLYEEDIYRKYDDGELLDLSPYIENDPSFNLADIYATARELMVIEGKTWGIPAGCDMIMYFYNKDLFDRFGVPYPTDHWNWQDFFYAAQAITHPEEDIYGYGTFQPEVDAFLLMYAHGGNIVDSLTNPTQLTMNNPLNVEALDWFARMFYEYGIALDNLMAESKYDDSGNSLYNAIRNGQIGIWPDIYSVSTEYAESERLKFNWGIAPLPSDVQGSTYGFCEAYAISAQSANPEAAWKWLSFLSQQVPNRMMPVRESHFEAPDYLSRIGAESAAAVRAALQNRLVFNIQIFNRPEYGRVLQTFPEMLQQVFRGELTAQEALDQIQEGAGP